MQTSQSLWFCLFRVCGWAVVIKFWWAWTVAESLLPQCYVGMGILWWIAGHALCILLPFFIQALCTDIRLHSVSICQGCHFIYLEFRAFGTQSSFVCVNDKVAVVIMVICTKNNIVPYNKKSNRGRRKGIEGHWTVVVHLKEMTWDICLLVFLLRVVSLLPTQVGKEFHFASNLVSPHVLLGSHSCRDCSDIRCRANSYWYLLHLSAEDGSYCLCNVIL